MLVTDWGSDEALAREALRLEILLGKQYARDILKAGWLMQRISQLKGFLQALKFAPGIWPAVIAAAAQVLLEIVSYVFTRSLLQAALQSSGLARIAFAMAKAYSRGQPLLFKRAVKQTTAKMIRDNVQTKVAEESYKAHLKSKKWTSTSTEQLKATASPTTPPPVPQGLGVRAFEHHRNEIADARNFLDQLRTEQGKSDRLDKSIHKVEAYIDKLEQAHSETNYANYTRQQQENFAKHRKMYRIAARGKTAKGHGGAYGAYLHQRLKQGGSYRGDCLKTARTSMAIAARNFKQVLRLTNKAISGKGMSVLDVVAAYKTATYYSAALQKPGRQILELTEKETDNGISITSRQRIKSGAPKLVEGIEDRDSGVSGSPNQISGPIATQALRLLNQALGEFS
jgi:hypothetical protein